MAVRNGKEYIQGLDDGRQVWVGDSKQGVVGNQLFAGSLQGMAGYFDWQLAHAQDCVTIDPDSGEQMAASLVIPRTQTDLQVRRRCFDSIANYSMGSLGRTPDYLNATLAGFAARDDIFRNSTDPKSADRLLAFYREVVAKDLAMTHTIIQPAIDKSAGSLGGMNADLALRVVRRTPNGIVLSGAKVLATYGPFADEIFVYPGGEPLAPDKGDHALVFSIPVNTKGLIQICRDHYGVQRPIEDAPFSSRFDEQDCFLIFDEVEVPYERVFIDGDVAAYNNLIFGGWAANIQHQTGIRAAVKLEFAFELGLAMAHATNCSGKPDVAAMLGEILTFARLTRAATQAAETNARDYGNGALYPDDKPTLALRCSMPEWMVRTSEILIQLGSHNLLATPTLSAFSNPEIAPLLERYLPGANGVTAQERARLFRMAWDFVGSALGARNTLYERFYLGSRMRALSGDAMTENRIRSFTHLAEFAGSIPAIADRSHTKLVA